MTRKKLILRRRSPLSSNFSSSAEIADIKTKATSSHRSVIFLRPADKETKEYDTIKPINLVAVNSLVSNARVCEVKSSGFKNQVRIEESGSDDESIVSNQTFASNSFYSADCDEYTISSFDKSAVNADKYESKRCLELHDNCSTTSPTDKNYIYPKNNEYVSVKKDISLQTSLEFSDEPPIKISSHTQTSNEIHFGDDIRNEGILTVESVDGSLKPATPEHLEGQKVLWTSLSLANTNLLLTPSVRRLTTVGEIVTSSPNNSLARPKPRMDLAISSPSSSHSSCSNSYEPISNSSSSSSSSSSSLSSFISIEDFEISETEETVSYSSLKRASTLEKTENDLKGSEKRRSPRKAQIERAVMLRQKFSISNPSKEAGGVR